MIVRVLKSGLFWLLIPVFGLSQNVTWEKGALQKSIAESLLILEDKEGSYNLGEVRSDSLFKNFIKSDKVILNFGFNTSCYWLHFTLDAPSDSLLLELAHTHLENVEFYAIDQQGKTVSLQGGYSIPLHQKFKKHHFQIFPVSKGYHQYFVKISQPVQPLPVRIHEADFYEIKTYRQRLVFGFYLGLIFFVVLSNLFFYVSLRNNLFLFYSGIVLVYLSYACLVMDGFIVYFIDNVDLIFWYKNIPTIGVPLQMMYALVFLEMKKYAPRLHRNTWWLIYYFIAYAIIKFFIPVKDLLAMNTIHALISFFGMFYLGYRAYKTGNKLGLYFAYAYLIYFILVLVEATYVQIGTPGYLMELSFVAWATLIEAFILSFLLSKRFEWEKEETERQKNEAQVQLLQKTIENEKFVREQNITLEKRVSERTNELNNSLENLKQAQAQLIQSEKMASLGELTAGIAHEIQNPLNFVNNFSEVSTELVDEIFEAAENKNTDEVLNIAGDLKANLEKITHHGKRAGDIVKGMLQHSRNNQGIKEPTNVNDVCNEYLKLAYHGFRAKDKTFNANLETSFDPDIPIIETVSQDIGRVILNVITNAFFAINERNKKNEPGYTPIVNLTTKKDNEHIRISIKDNGLGIPDTIKDKIFQPFFTTKPTGQGTGLGLSLSYDIIKSIGGNILVESKNDVGTEFIILIPISK